jgi:hypothetical protein
MVAALMAVRAIFQSTSLLGHHPLHDLRYAFTTKLWLYQGKGAWHFVTLPKEAADEIRFHNPLARGFMPIACEATIGKTSWKTSVFPDSKSGSYVLAVKADVRKAEGIRAGDAVSVTIVMKSAL